MTSSTSNPAASAAPPGGQLLYSDPLVYRNAQQVSQAGIKIEGRDADGGPVYVSPQLKLCRYEFGVIDVDREPDSLGAWYPG